jgi:hypothetical protein
MTGVDHICAHLTSHAPVPRTKLSRKTRKETRRMKHALADGSVSDELMREHDRAWLAHLDTLPKDQAHEAERSLLLWARVLILMPDDARSPRDWFNAVRERIEGNDSALSPTELQRRFAELLDPFAHLDLDEDDEGAVAG